VRLRHYHLWRKGGVSCGSCGQFREFLLCWAHLLLVVVCPSIVAESFLNKFVVAARCDFPCCWSPSLELRASLLAGVLHSKAAWSISIGVAWSCMRESLLVAPSLLATPCVQGRIP
jgi:hypothetical protein